MTLDGKVALLTGVRRVGAVVAETLAGAGADVALVYNRSAREADATAATVRALGRRAVTIQANLGKADDCRRAVETTARELGRVDVLVAMASLYSSAPLPDVTVEAWDTQMDVELRSAFLCAQAAVPIMRSQWRRPDRRLQRLAAGQRAATVSRVPHLLRRQGWTESAR